MTDPTMFQTPTVQTRMNQIQSVAGFDGARNHARTLTNGSSEIVSDSDPNLARIYIVAMDHNGSPIVQGFNLIPVEEPKPVTIDDLNDKMNILIERLDQLEREKVKKDDKSDFSVTTRPATTRTDPSTISISSCNVKESDGHIAAVGDAGSTLSATSASN